METQMNTLRVNYAGSSQLMCPCHYDDKAGVVTVAMYSEFSVAVISGSSTLIGIFYFFFSSNSSPMLCISPSTAAASHFAMLGMPLRWR